MFQTIFLKEISTGLKRPMIYIFLILFTTIGAFGVIIDNIKFGGAIGNVFKNAPHVMSLYIANLSIFGLLIATAYFNNAALRDFQHQFNEILFSTSMHKASYFFGRFFGALFLTSIPLLGVFLGFSLGTNIIIESGNSHRIGEIATQSFVNNFLLFILPNMFVAGAIIFAVANKWKNTIISFIATILIIVAYLISGTFVNDISTEGLAALTDIFGLRAYTIDTKYFTTLEKNTEIVSFSGWLLINRILWVSVGLITLMVSYFSFSFVQKNKKITKENSKKKMKSSVQTFTLPKVQTRFNFSATRTQFVSFFRINFYSLFKSNTFKIMLIFGALILLNKLINGFEYYGLQSYHVTYKMLDFNRPISMLIGMIMLVFFSGELVWKERASNIHGVIDGTPHHSTILLLAKIASLVVINIVFDLFLVFISISYQLINGFANPEIGVYLLDFIYAGLPMYLIWSGILVFIQILINHKYVAYFVSVLLIFLFEFVIVDAMEISSFMLNLGFTPSYQYSDMNKFSEALISRNWFSIYWMFFGAVLICIASLLWVRGITSGVKNRWKTAKKQVTKKFLIGFAVVSFLFVLTSSFVYYNTQVLNSYSSASEIKTMQEAYEKKYKKYEVQLQPKITAIKYEVEVYPYDRNVNTISYITIENKGDKAIDSLHYSLIHFVNEELDGMELNNSNWKKTIKIPKSKLVYDDKELGYQIFKLAQPLLPNQTMDIKVETNYKSQGFENSVSNIRVINNGTFFDSTSLLPSFGYETYNEITDTEDRRDRGLAPRENSKPLDNSSEATQENYILGSLSDWVEIETLISTSIDQTAIAPGSLVKQWTADGRSYFNYKNDHSSLNFTNFMSAKYELARKNWKGITIEVYYHETHDYNIDMMLAAVEKSLAYYTENFGPYDLHQARVVEIPRYYNFAQAFPGTMPYTEGGGFITNLTNKNDNNVIYSIIAHEMAHQYWAHQLIGANMQGATMLSESFAEYSALMMIKNELKDDIKMKQFLKYDFEKYLRGRGNETQQEMPLYKVADQGYVHYGKGSLVLYALQDYIGEEKVNAALRNFLEAYKYKAAPYPTSLDFIRYLEPQVPEEFQYLITDWFKEITLYDYRLKEATYKAKAQGKYEVFMTIEAAKIKVDSLGQEHRVAQDDWVDIGVYADLEEKELMYTKRVKFSQQHMEFTIEVDQLPAKAVIDPKRLLIERVIDDNVKILYE